jgi:3-oxoacyl-[acyl-carrier protein] reductase
MDLALRDKVAFITGSTKGIGLAIAEEFLAEGSRVVVTGRDRERVRAVSARLAEKYGKDRALGFEADFTAGDDAVKSVLQQARDGHGRLDIVVANVGSGRGKSALDTDSGDWERMIGLNLISAGITARHAVPFFSESGGSIVLIASIAGMEVLPAPPAYLAAKAGTIALGKALSRELARRNIRVNVVSPGNVLHEGGSWEEKMKRDPEGTSRYIESEVPLRRFGTDREIAAAVVFLSSERAAGFVTGANLVVDGGQTRGF